MEVTKWLKPSDSVSRIGDSASLRTHRFPAAVFFTVGNTDELRQLKLGRRVDPL